MSTKPIGDRRVPTRKPARTQAPQPGELPLSEQQRQRIDAEMHADKLANGYSRRNYLSALADQVQAHPEHWGIA